MHVHYTCGRTVTYGFILYRMIIGLLAFCGVVILAVTPGDPYGMRVDETVWDVAPMRGLFYFNAIWVGFALGLDLTLVCTIIEVTVRTGGERGVKEQADAAHRERSHKIRLRVLKRRVMPWHAFLWVLLHGGVEAAAATAVCSLPAEQAALKLLLVEAAFASYVVVVSLCMDVREVKAKDGEQHIAPLHTSILHDNSCEDLHNFHV